MWFSPPDKDCDWSGATRRLVRVEKRFAPLVRKAGACDLSPRKDYFVLLCQAIFSQQISTAVATVLFARFRGLFPNKRPTPARLLQCTDEQLRSVGLSAAKMVYLRDLARRIDEGKLPLRRLGRLDDETVIEKLTAVRGIGRWSAEMFLIFVLNRPDILPVDDLGLRRGMQKLLTLPSAPTGRQCQELAELWRPWRTVATWYLWRGYE